MSFFDDLIGRTFGIWPNGHVRGRECWRYGRHFHLPLNRVWWGRDA